MDSHNDSSNILHHPAAQWAEQKPQPERSRYGSPELHPLTVEEASAYLSRCLTLCAPTGMTVEDRVEWLDAALEAIGEIPASVFIDACKHVQTKCDHPAKIIPVFTAFAEAAENTLRRKISWESDNPWKHVSGTLAGPAPEPPRKMTQGDVDILPGHLVSLGLTMGYLRKDGDQILLVEDDAA